MLVSTPQAGVLFFRRAVSDPHPRKISDTTCAVALSCSRAVSRLWPSTALAPSAVAR
jgi:hypothetical protein